MHCFKVLGMLLAIAAFSLLVFVPTPVMAEHGEGFKTEVGVKTWIAQWQAPVLFTTCCGDAIQMTTQSVAMIGPTGTLSYTRHTDSEWFRTFFASASYLTSDAFNFQFSKLGGFTEVKADRADTTLTFGATVYRGIGFYAGYYNNDQTIRFLSSTGTRSTRSRKFDGAILGAFATEAVSDWLSIYGNVGMAALTYTFQGTNVNPNVLGWSTEAGFKIQGHLLSKLGAEAQLGMRVQSLNTYTTNSVTGSEQHANDLTWGPIMSLTASF